MKKLLLASVACGALAVATPATAGDGVTLDLGGHFKGYTVFSDQDENNGDVHDLDIVRETEIHFTGETTLDNGLTVGFHAESDIDNSNGDNFNNEESYAYFSSGWGRVNFGKEDGAAYLLQVAAPSADSNIDGVRQYVQAVNYTALSANTAAVSGLALDYDHDVSEKSNKLTYITPVFSGFQAGVSYTPDVGGTSRGLDGVNLDDQDDDFGEVLDLAVRYEGQFEEVTFALGGGYSDVSLEQEDVDTASDPSDDRQVWNVGLDMDWGPFGLGASWSEDDRGDQDVDGTAGGATIDDEEILVIGVDYTHGPYTLGASYYDSENTFGVQDLDTERWAGGVTYTYGPGMTFRGSVQYVDHDHDSNANFFATGEDSVDATSVLVGTQINF